MNNAIKFSIFSLLMTATIAIPMKKNVSEPQDYFIGDLDKVKVLNALYKAARPIGLGILKFRPNDSLTKEEATEILQERNGYVDYLRGRGMKVYLSEDSFSTQEYNEYYGKGAAEKVIENLRNPKNTEEKEDLVEKLKDADPTALLMRILVENSKK